jgi:hypothetical protein
MGAGFWGEGGEGEIVFLLQLPVNLKLQSVICQLNHTFLHIQGID